MSPFPILHKDYGEDSSSSSNSQDFGYPIDSPFQPSNTSVRSDPSYTPDIPGTPTTSRTPRFPTTPEAPVMSSSRRRQVSPTRATWPSSQFARSSHVEPSPVPPMRPRMLSSSNAEFSSKMLPLHSSPSEITPLPSSNASSSPETPFSPSRLATLPSPPVASMKPAWISSPKTEELGTYARDGNEMKRIVNRDFVPEFTEFIPRVMNMNSSELNESQSIDYQKEKDDIEKPLVSFHVNGITLNFQLKNDISAQERSECPENSSTLPWKLRQRPRVKYFCESSENDSFSRKDSDTSDMKINLRKRKGYKDDSWEVYEPVEEETQTEFKEKDKTIEFTHHIDMSKPNNFAWRYRKLTTQDLNERFTKMRFLYARWTQFVRFLKLYKAGDQKKNPFKASLKSLMTFIDVCEKNPPKCSLRKMTHRVEEFLIHMIGQSQDLNYFKFKMESQRWQTNNDPLKAPNSHIVRESFASCFFPLKHQIVLDIFYDFCVERNENPFLCQPELLVNFYQTCKETFLLNMPPFQAFLAVLDPFHFSFNVEKIHLKERLACTQVINVEDLIKKELLYIKGADKSTIKEVFEATPDYKFDKYVQLHSQDMFWTEEVVLKSLLQLCDPKTGVLDSGESLSELARIFRVSREMVLSNAKKLITPAYELNKKTLMEFMLSNTGNMKKSFWKLTYVQEATKMAKLGTKSISSGAFEVGASLIDFKEKVNKCKATAKLSKPEKDDRFRKLPKKAKKIEAKVDGDNDGKEKLSEYEKIRLRNIEDRKKLFESMNLNSIKGALDQSCRPKKQHSSSKLKMTDLMERRQSKRVQTIESRKLALKPTKTIEDSLNLSRETYVPIVNDLPIGNLASSEFSLSYTRCFQSCLTQELEAASSEHSQKDVEIVSNISTSFISSAAIFPDPSLVLLASGNTDGALSLWFLPNGGSNQSGVPWSYHPHTQPITKVAFDIGDKTKIITSGLDGYMRKTDLNRMTLDVTYQWNEHFVNFESNETFIEQFVQISPNEFVIVHRSGHVSLYDQRGSSYNMLLFENANMVDVNPKYNNIIAFLDDKSITIGDLRKVEQICEKQFLYKKEMTKRNIKGVSFGGHNAEDLLTIFQTGPKVYRFSDGFSTISSSFSLENSFKSNSFGANKIVWHYDNSEDVSPSLIGLGENNFLNSEKLCRIEVETQREAEFYCNDMALFNPNYNITVDPNSKSILVYNVSDSGSAYLLKKM